MTIKWRIKGFDEKKADQLHEKLKINKILCAILVQRGIDTYAKAESYFRPKLSELHDPWLMKDMRKAVDRIIQAIQTQEKILIYGDYDVDGTTSVAALFGFLKKIHPHIDFYIPHRHREGYGISQEGIDFAIAHQFNLVISIDCGIKANQLITYAKTHGLDFIVCDHHLPDTEIPPAIAILNPKQEDCKYPYKELCGCGVGFKLMQALSETLLLPEESWLSTLDLLALAIAADIVPMTGENRVLTYFGLERINQSPNYGIAALIELALKTKKIHITNLVFALAPRINAAGRMDDARKVVQLFIEENKDKALEYAEMLHFANIDRKEADKNITEEALSMIENSPDGIQRKSTVVYNPVWHKGVIGIVASRLVENYYRPTVVLTKSGEVVSGSARSVPGFNLYEAIHACRAYLLGYGGHFAAAGLTLLEENIEKFSNAFENVVKETIREESLIPQLWIDAEISFSAITKNFYHIITQMEPFGPDNMRPVFISRNVKDYGFSKIVKDQHIRFSLQQQGITFTGIGFNMAEKFHLLKEKDSLDIVYTIDENEWNGTKTLQLKVIDFVTHSPEKAFL
ncbi:MAG: single-stranded-DNA-specific exonuclease RecJ [Bacteroidetes bacterium]|nr:single-stranded-DNA-specific exonuclease RecJ [Bacteroidota bacterium]